MCGKLRGRQSACTANKKGRVIKQYPRVSLLLFAVCQRRSPAWCIASAQRSRRVKPERATTTTALSARWMAGWFIWMAHHSRNSNVMDCRRNVKTYISWVARNKTNSRFRVNYFAGSVFLWPIGVWAEIALSAVIDGLQSQVWSAAAKINADCRLAILNLTEMTRRNCQKCSNRVLDVLSVNEHVCHCKRFTSEA